MLATEPDIERKKDGVNRVPVKRVPMNTLSKVTVIPAFKPKSTMVVSVMILAKPNFSHGKGVGMEDSSVWIIMASDARRDRKTLCLKLSRFI